LTTGLTAILIGVLILASTFGLIYIAAGFFATAITFFAGINTLAFGFTAIFFGAAFGLAAAFLSCSALSASC
jgi:hypothetical protein